MEKSVTSNWVLTFSALSLALLANLGGGNLAWAQDVEKSWTSGSEVGAGRFIIYNVGTGGYVDGGFSGWGTEGGIYKNPRFYTFTLNNGDYNIDTEISNGGDNHYMQANTWLDGGAVGQTFTQLSSGAYTFGNGGNLFGATAKGAVWTLSADGTNTEWLLISEDEYKGKLKELEYDGHTYFNASALIKGARSFRNFTNGIDKNGNWTITNTGNKNLNGGGAGNKGEAYKSAAEFYNATFDMRQTIEDVPNGKYVFSVQGFQRISNNTKPAVIFANEAESPMMLLGEGSATGANSMTAAGEAMFNGDFDDNKVTVIVTNHTLTVGLKKETLVDGTDWVIFNNFSLHYYGLDLSELKEALNGRIAAGEALETFEGKYETALAGPLATAIATAKTAAGSNDEDEIIDAQNALNTAISNIENSAAAYAKVKASLDAADAIVASANLDAAGLAAYDAVVADIKSAYEANTLVTTECDAKIADIDAAWKTAVKSQAPGSDWTLLITNPSFEDGITGWTSEGIGEQTNTAFGKTGNKYAEAWQPNGTKSVEQTITALPDGIYAVTVRAKARGITSAELYANDVKAALKIADEENDYTVKLAVNGDLKIGLTAVGTGAGSSWIAFDNFRLTYVGSAADYLNGEIAEAATVDTEAKMDATVKAAFESALAAANAALASGTAEEKYAAANALKEAAVAVNSSINDYATVKNLIDDTNDLLASTNVYTAEAYATFVEDANVSEWEAAYEAGNADVEALKGKYNAIFNPSHGWHAAVTVDDFLLSAWADANEFSGKYYINTWSNEGEKDGSNMKTPFFEYWTNDDKVLGEYTLTATQTGLTPNKIYTVSALVRVHVTTGQTAAENGVTLQVGGAIPVDVCHGTAIANNYNYGTYTACGAADKDGNLTIQFNVAAGSNVSWLAFKNVKYAEAVDAADMVALNAAIADAEAKSFGFEAGEYAPYNNVAAITALAAAKSACGYEAQASIDALAAALAAATWTANTEEVNAIYDGDFTKHAYNEDGANEQAFAWTGDAGHNDATNVRHQYDKTANPGLAASEGEALFIKFGASYGKTAGYTMPLKANTAYKLTFIYGGWGTDEGQIRSNVGKGLTVTTPNGETINLTPEAIQANKGGHSDASTWKAYTGVFTTAEAGDYVLNFVHKWQSNEQDQYVFSNLNLVKAPVVDATMAISGAKYSTFIAPFEVSVPAGVTASKVTGVAENGYTLVTEEVEGAIPANTPVLLYSETAVSQTFQGQSLAVENAYTTGLLTGVHTATPAPVDAYVLQNQNGKVAFYHVEEGAQPTVGAGRAYLTAPATSEVRAFFAFDDEATGIDTVVNAQSLNGQLYDLSGRRVNKAVKGIYIINGKKVMK